MNLRRLARRSVKSKPSWLRLGVDKKRREIKLTGDSTWKGQPVIDVTKVVLKDGLTGIRVNQAMMKEWRFVGTKGRNRFIFGDQAGAITKRGRSIIDFGVDKAKDVFVFKNTTPKSPFNHQQRFFIKNFGKQDVIKLRNIGKTFRYGDIRQDGTLPGVSPTKLFVDLIG